MIKELKELSTIRFLFAKLAQKCKCLKNISSNTKKYIYWYGQNLAKTVVGPFKKNQKLLVTNYYSDKNALYG